MLITIGLLILTAFFNRCMDTVAYHYDYSIFRRLKRQWWDLTISWRNKYKFGNKCYWLKYRFPFAWLIIITDAWHMFKFCMVTTLCLTIIYALNAGILIDCSLSFSLFMLVLFGIIWNLCFSIFENILEPHKPRA